MLIEVHNTKTYAAKKEDQKRQKINFTHINTHFGCQKTQYVRQESRQLTGGEVS